MAKLMAPVDNAGGFETGELAPAGDFVATCIDIDDQFGVTRQKFQSTETELVDETRFLFGFLSPDGQQHFVQTFEMRISGNPKSNLFKFLSAWLGRPPEMGWDYCELKGQGAIIRVEHRTGKTTGKVYAVISSISPVKTTLADHSAQVIPAASFSLPDGQAPQVAQAPQAPPVAPAPQAPAPAPVPPAPSAAPYIAPNDDDNVPF